MLVMAQVHPAVTASLIAVFLFVCVLLILAVLIQRPAGGGLSGAFGSGAGSGQTAFGAKTGDALTIATITIFAIYLIFAAGLNFAARPAGGLAPAAPGVATPPPATIPTGDAPAPTGQNDVPPPPPAGANPAIPAPAVEQPAAPAAIEPTAPPVQPPPVLPESPGNGG